MERSTTDSLRVVVHAAADPASSYLAQRAPLALIFGSFFCLFLPLVLLLLLPNFFDWLPHLLALQAIGLGTSHFFITLALYFQRANLSYFASSLRNRVIYFAIPCGILISFGVIEAARLPARAPALVAAFFAGVRLFDFYHVGRQSVGVLQLLERGGAGSTSRGLRTSENAFFVGMALLQWQTFLLGGQFTASRLSASLPALGLAALFVFIAVMHVRRATRVDVRQRWVPLSYFALQAICSAVAVYQTRLYLVALSLHYVEYHLLMSRRCLGPARDQARNAWVLYGSLALVVVLFELRHQLPHELAPATGFFVHVFDGIFLLHYFVEAFVWKFSNPFYRDQLTPLYFPTISPPVQPQPALPTRRIWPRIAGAVALTTACVLLCSSNRVSRIIDPLYVQSHLRWGIELARAGRLEDARRHLESVLQRDVRNRHALSALRWIEGRVPTNSATR